MAKKPEEAQGTTDNQEAQAQTGNDIDTGADTAQADKTAAAQVPQGRGGEPKSDADAPAQPALESLTVLADRHRIASWQQAALMRCMGWETGKMATDAEYRAALARLKSRPMGGGRLV